MFQGLSGIIYFSMLYKQQKRIWFVLCIGMGISASSVCETLRTSPEFNSVVNSVYQNSLALTQHAFPGIKPYQLLSASDQIHASLTLINYLPVLKWVSSPPTRSQVDHAFKSVASQQDVTLGEDDFREFAIDLYGNAVVSSARKAVMLRIPVGIAGIVVVMGTANRLVKAAVGVCAVALYFGTQ